MRQTKTHTKKSHSCKQKSKKVKTWNSTSSEIIMTSLAVTLIVFRWEVFELKQINQTLNVWTVTSQFAFLSKCTNCKLVSRSVSQRKRKWEELVGLLDNLLSSTCTGVLHGWAGQLHPPTTKKEKTRGPLCAALPLLWDICEHIRLFTLWRNWTIWNYVKIFCMCLTWHPLPNTSESVNRFTVKSEEDCRNHERPESRVKDGDDQELIWRVSRQL